MITCFVQCWCWTNKSWQMAGISLVRTTITYIFREILTTVYERYLTKVSLCMLNSLDFPQLLAIYMETPVSGIAACFNCKPEHSFAFWYNSLLTTSGEANYLWNLFITLYKRKKRGLNLTADCYWIDLKS